MERIKDDKIPDMMESILDRQPKQRTEEFVGSLQEFYEENGFLTESQYDTLVDIFYECDY